MRGKVLAVTVALMLGTATMRPDAIAVGRGGGFARGPAIGHGGFARGHAIGNAGFGNSFGRRIALGGAFAFGRGVAFDRGFAFRRGFRSVEAWAVWDLVSTDGVGPITTPGTAMAQLTRSAIAMSRSPMAISRSAMAIGHSAMTIARSAMAISRLARRVRPAAIILMRK